MTDVRGELTSPLVGGFNITPANLGTPTNGSTVTIKFNDSPEQFLTNNVAGFTIAAPATTGSCFLLVTNGASAGNIAFAGFSVPANTGDPFDTIVAHNFTVSIWCINGVAGYRVAAHQ